MARYHFRFCKLNPSDSLPIIVSHRIELCLFLFDFYIKKHKWPHSDQKTVKKYTTKNSQFCDKNYFRNVTNVSCIGENCPKYLIINKTPKSTFCHVTSHTPTQLCPCIKVLIAFESSSMRIDSTYAHFWRPRKGPKRN